MTNLTIRRHGLEHWKGEVRWLRGQAAEITAAVGPDNGRDPALNAVALAKLPRLSSLSAYRAGAPHHPRGP